MNPGTTTTGDAVRDHVHELWASVAAGWAANSDFVDRRHEPVTARLLDAADLRPGEKVVELACGGGGVGLAAAPRVAPGGEVVLSDVVAEMTAIAAARAAEAGARGVTTRVLDLEALDLPDGSFDVAFCRDGLQFALDPARAACEVQRVLRPGGRFALAVWAARERNPWLGIVFDSVSAVLGMTVPPPGVPTPFSLGDPTDLGALLRDVGFDGVTIDEVSVPLRVPSADAWWAMTTALAGPVAALLASLPADVAAAVRAKAIDATRPYATASGIELPGVGLVAYARRR